MKRFAHRQSRRGVNAKVAKSSTKLGNHSLHFTWKSFAPFTKPADPRKPKRLLRHSAVRFIVPHRARPSPHTHTNVYTVNIEPPVQSTHFRLFECRKLDILYSGWRVRATIEPVFWSIRSSIGATIARQRPTKASDVFVGPAHLAVALSRLALRTRIPPLPGSKNHPVHGKVTENKHHTDECPRPSRRDRVRIVEFERSTCVAVSTVDCCRFLPKPAALSIRFRLKSAFVLQSVSSALCIRRYLSVRTCACAKREPSETSTRAVPNARNPLTAKRRPFAPFVCERILSYLFRNIEIFQVCLCFKIVPVCVSSSRVSRRVWFIYVTCGIVVQKWA